MEQAAFSPASVVLDFIPIQN
ncbi:hypothetical protein NIES2130_25715 [Scytonema sp. HK-05]|nr:hypothetical protein NIES2130_25715 [Scytonema sp. HK-05]